MSRAVLDTSVIVEYIDRRGELHEQAAIVMEAVVKGKLEALIPHPVLTEVYYVSLRLYRALSAEDPESRARKLLEWLYQLPTITIPEPTVYLALEAGAMKDRYGLALTDCYVLAAAKLYRAVAVFEKREKEMKKRPARLEGGGQGSISGGLRLTSCEHQVDIEGPVRAA